MAKNPARGNSRWPYSRSHCVAVFGLTTFSFLFWGCSKTEPPQPKPGATAQAPGAPPADAKPESGGQMDERLPPILKTAWKGDLDEIVKRRVVRVLVPFRRPEFFYIDGQPAGILQEAFRELEKVLNATHKTTAANHIIVALVPTPADKLRDRMLGGYGDIAAYGISITPENKALVDFTIPTMTGQKIVAVTGPRAPELKTMEDLSGKEVWITPGTRLQKTLST